MNQRLLVPLIAFVASIACADDPISRLPACRFEAASPSATWSRVPAPFDDISFSMPSTFHQASEQTRFMHGGGQWNGPGCDVTVSYGMWGLSSFNPEGAENVCQTVINGIPAVLISSSSNETHGLTAWLRTKAEPYEPVLAIRCSGKDDFSLARAVVGSITRTASK